MDSSSPRFISRSLVYFLALESIILLAGLKTIRTQMTINNQSPFETNANTVFLVIGAVMLFVSELTSLILFWTNTSLSYYAILKFVAIFSATFAPLSLMLVIYTPVKHSLVNLLPGYVIMGIAIALMFSGDDDRDKTLYKSSLISVLTHLGFVILPVTFVLVVFAPIDLDWMVYHVIKISAGMQFVCYLIIYIKFMFIEGLKAKMDPSPPRFISRSLVYNISMYSLVALGGLKHMRTQMTEKKQSAFEINGNAMFLVIGVVMLILLEATTLILFWTKVSSKYYSKLKFAGIFSCFLSPFSLVLVTDGSDKQDLVNSLLIYIVLGVALAFISSRYDTSDMSVNRSSLLFGLTHLTLVVLPVVLMMVLFIPIKLDWLVYPLVYSSMGMQAISFFIFFFIFMYPKMTVT